MGLGTCLKCYGFTFLIKAVNCDTHSNDTFRLYLYTSLILYSVLLVVYVLLCYVLWGMGRLRVVPLARCLA